ncbi:hypothetical protein BRD22_01780 [Halobacteriales archaeon SW_8_68_21]|nr:MAG: hypothetical protein BRD22_01780 [Halobacteriales archaeon SW_8_68_21]
MTRLRFALLNAAHDGANTRRNFRREIDADLVEFDVTAGDLPDHADFDGVVVTGSRSSVYWDVCYGHQVLAEALGGRVAGMDGFEIGYNEIRRTRDDPLFDGIGDSFTAFTTHGDVVVELPPSATLLAENDRGVHAFRDGHCWGVQFHPEYDAETAREVTDGKRDRISDARVDAVLAEITPEAYDAACEAKPLFDNFVAYARRLKADRGRSRRPATDRDP